MTHADNLVTSTDGSRRCGRRQLVRVLAAGVATAGLGLQTVQGQAARKHRRPKRPVGALHQHKDNPTAYPAHPAHRISK